MTDKEAENRIVALEKAVADLQQRLSSNGTHPSEDPRTMDPKTQRPWWREDAGRFKDDPDFEEMVRLGREYRESLRPGRRSKAKKRVAKSKAKNART